MYGFIFSKWGFFLLTAFFLSVGISDEFSGFMPLAAPILALAVGAAFVRHLWLNRR